MQYSLLVMISPPEWSIWLIAMRYCQTMFIYISDLRMDNLIFAQFVQRSFGFLTVISGLVLK